MEGNMDALKAALLGRSGSKKQVKSEVTDNLCHKLLTLFVWSPAPFFMEAAPNVMVVSLSALKAHLGGRTSIADLKAALHKLVSWAPVETFKESFGVAVVKFRQPKLFREAVTSGLTPYTLLGLPKKKARLIDAAVSRMMKEIR